MPHLISSVFIVHFQKTDFFIKTNIIILFSCHNESPSFLLSHNMGFDKGANVLKLVGAFF